MNPLLEKIAKTASDTTSFAKSVADAGVRYVETQFREMEVFGSLHVLAEKELARDETHYLLIPIPDGESNYEIHTKRVIPVGEGAENSLPKAKIFHVPDKSAISVIEDLLVTDAVGQNLAAQQPESDFSDRLEECADQIDQSVEAVGGGLLLLGGAILCFNPVIGIGLAATGLLSTAGSKASKMGASLLGDRIRSAKEEKGKQTARKDAEKAIRKLKPEVFENPILKSLAAVLHNSESEYDPFLDDRNRVDAFDEYRRYAITLEAVSHAFSEKKVRAKLKETHRKWIEHLIEMHADQWGRE